MSLEENKAIVRRAYEEAWNNKNLDALDELLPVDYDMHQAGAAQSGRALIKQQIAVNHVALPDLHVTIEDLIAEGDKVVMRGTWTGTHLGELRSRYGVAPPTGKRVTWTGMHMFRIAGGRIVEAFYHTDDLGRLQQFGLLDAPPEPGR